MHCVAFVVPAMAGDVPQAVAVKTKARDDQRTFERNQESKTSIDPFGFKQHPPVTRGSGNFINPRTRPHTCLDGPCESDQMLCRLGTF